MVEDEEPCGLLMLLLEEDPRLLKLELELLLREVVKDERLGEPLMLLLDKLDEDPGSLELEVELLL